MKASELRIGNWASEENESEEYFELQIINYNWIKDHDAFEPIPLTEEWLVKFGFEYCSESEGFQMKGFHVENREFDKYSSNIKKDEFGIWFINSCLVDLKHVHQLQNLYFALTGEELTLQP